MGFVPETELGILESPEEVLTTLTRDGKRKWIYPVPAPGKLLNARRIVGWLLIVFFVALPIVPINGNPAIFLDLASRQFHLFGATFFPTDTFLLWLLAVAIGAGILLFTAVLGRVWCGWACPQTVYLEFVYRPIERFIEGGENARRKRDAGPWTFDKAWRRSLKVLIFGVISFLLAHTFVAYFAGWSNLLEWMQGDPREHWGYFVMMSVVTLGMLYNFGYFREQLCTIACPYARFQSVLLDPDSLIVSYDPNRGEPRGRGKKREGLGDCVDCMACVRTCPTGIDIRDGLQMECIACTQCIDACDSIMDRVGKPRGLIRYSSERAIEDGAPTRALRPRTLVYGSVFLIMLAAFSFKVATREAYDVNIGRVVDAPYMELPDGRIANRLRIRVRNQTPETATFSIGVAEPANAEVRVVGVQPISVNSTEMERPEVWVIVPREAFQGGTANATFVLDFSDGTVVRPTFTLLSPNP